MRAAVDTNVLVYAEGLDDPVRQGHAIAVLDRAADQRVVIPVQVLGELFNVLVRKGSSPERAKAVVMEWAGKADLAETTSTVLGLAVDLAAQHDLSIWDAVILAASAEAECDLLLSEDMQDGFRWRGVTVVNPFAANPSPLLDAFLAQP